MNHVLRMKSVSAGYGMSLIVNELSIDVVEGGCLALLGPNGVGKTTTLNAIYGIARRHSGEIEIDGQRLGRRPHEAARLGAALVPQGRWIINNLTVEENLILGQASERSGAWTLERVFSLFPDLEKRRSAMGNALSGGQQQMIAVGRALMANPRILILDEPSEGLAPVVIDRMGDVLAALREEGTSMLLVEQRLDLVHRLADTYAVMSKGTLVSQGLVADVDPQGLRDLVTI